MPNWNTEKIINDLWNIPNVDGITNEGQGGDVDTDNLCIHFRNSPHPLYVCGFDTENDITSPADIDVPMIELSDRLYSNGGLNSSNRITSIAYIDIREYFMNLGFHVVPTHKDYF